MRLKNIVIYCFVALLCLFMAANNADCRNYSPIKIVPPPEIYNIDEVIQLDTQKEKIKKDIKIAFVLDGPSELNEQITTVFKTEITELLKNEFNVSFPINKTLVSNWSRSDLKAKITNMMNDKDVDVIIPLGFISANCVTQIKSFSKPVIIPFLFKLEKDQSVKNLSNIKNLSYLKFKQKGQNDIQAFYELYPFKNLAVLINKDLSGTLSNLDIYIKKNFPDKNFAVKVIPVDNANIDVAMSQLDSSIDAVYVAPLTNLTSGQFHIVAEKLIEKKLPSFSYLGSSEVEKGILATITPSQNYQRIARQTAINVQRVLLGENASSLPITYNLVNRLSLNINTASKIGYVPNWKVRTEADYISEEEPQATNTMSLDSVISESLKSNLEIKAQAFDIITSLKEIKEARSDLLPQVDAQMGWLKLNGGVRQETFGVVSPHTLFSMVSMSQLIYSDKPYANMKIKKYLHESKKENQKSLELDVALDSGNIYLDLLMAKNLLKIQRKNIEISRHNLQLAESRQEIGTSSSSDIYRWQAEIAKNKQNVIRSEGLLKAQKILLNKILSHPQNEEFATQETDLSDPILLTNKEKIVKYLDDVDINENFVEFVTDEALNASPEISSLDFGIKAKQREITAINRQFWTPDIGFQLGYVGLTMNDVSSVKNSMSLGVVGKFPIFQGGKNYYKYGIAKKEFEKLEVQKQELKEQIEKKVRLALVKTSSTYPSIELSKEVASNSHKALDLITENYKEGTAKLVDLLDAQNAAISADQLAANSVYEFIKSLLGFQRSLGNVKFVMTGDQWDEWLNKFEEYKKGKTGITNEEHIY